MDILSFLLGRITADGSGGGGSANLGTLLITQNGQYDAADEGYDGYSEVSAEVPASAVDTGTKNITSNGDNQDVIGYAAVNVNVPNSYAAGDEGKVVNNGALVAQTAHADVTPGTSDQTIDTTLNDSIKVIGDADLVAGNIKKDVVLFGVTGTYEGSGGGFTPTLFLGGLSSHLNIKGNHVKVDAATSSGSAYINLRTMNYAGSSSSALSSPLWVTIPAGSIVNITISNVVNANNKNFDLNIKKANSTDSLGYSIGSSPHLSGESITVTTTAEEEWGTLFLYIGSFANSVIEFDITITVNGTRLL